MSVEITHHGVKLPKFVPCIGDRCPEMMQLEGEIAEELFGTPLVYRCQRRMGYRSRITGELYTGPCYFHEHPYKADDYAYWHRNAEKKTLAKERLRTAI